MACTLDFTSLYGGLAVGGAFALAAWAVWIVKYQPATLQPAWAGRSPIAGSADAWAGLLRQARLRIEAGHDATEILERAIDLVRARRMFIMTVTLILWTAATLALLQFVGGNSKCFRRLAGEEPQKLHRLADHPASEPGRSAITRLRSLPKVHMEPVHAPA